jgi:hypothetical protein
MTCALRGGYNYIPQNQNYKPFYILEDASVHKILEASLKIVEKLPQESLKYLPSSLSLDTFPCSRSLVVV